MGRTSAGTAAASAPCTAWSNGLAASPLLLQADKVAPISSSWGNSEGHHCS